MAGYLIYHPQRKKSSFDGVRVFHDRTHGNQDPYVWNDRFLHTYCHMTQISPEIGDTNFWVSGDRYPEFTKLYCDLVFVVDQKMYWPERNWIDVDDPIVDSVEAFNDHYQWAIYNHHFKRRRRFTLKADAETSFQPQDAMHNLIDMVEFLITEFYSLDALRRNIQTRRGSKPMRLSALEVKSLYNWIDQYAEVRLRGTLLAKIRKQNPQLASPLPKCR